MIREKTIQCDECMGIAPIKDHNFYTVFDDDYCGYCIDGVLANLNGPEIIKEKKTMVDLTLLEKEINELIDEKNEAQRKLDYWHKAKNLTMQVEKKAIRDTLDETINRLLRIKYEFEKQQGGI